MRPNSTKDLFAAATLLVIALFLSASSSRGQTPAASPSTEPGTTGNYTVVSTIETGVRGVSVNGDHEKYRSDLNYGAGFRLFDSSFLIENNSKGNKLFDSILIQTSGFGSDPSGSFRFNMDKTSIYKFDSNVRKVRYFNNLKNHVVNWSQRFPNGSEHRANTEHYFGDFDLTVFPERNYRLRFGYSFNNTEGPGTNTIRFGDEFQVASAIKTHSDDVRVGVEGKLLGFNMGLNFGHRWFSDRTRFFNDTFNIGNDPTGTASLSKYFRQYYVDGTTDFVHFFAQRTFARKLDFTGRVIYSHSISAINEADSLTGRNTAGNLVVADAIEILGRAKRPQTRADLGLTFRPTDKFRLSNTFTFDQFSSGGSNTLFEFVQSTTFAGAPLPNTTTRTSAYRATSYRRLSNLVEADFQINRRAAFNVGYRFTRRRVFAGVELDVNLVTGAVTRTSPGEEHENSTNTVIAGARLKPTTNWSIYVDVEKGDSDNVFTRLANDDLFNTRIRSVATMKDFTFNLSFITRNNDTNGTSKPITTGTPPVVVVPAFNATAETRSRIFSSSVDWTPSHQLSLSGGYTYQYLNATTDIIVPIGTPLLTPTTWFVGISRYFVRDSYFFFDISARPVDRVSFYASYRINDDRGQGDRVITRPQDFIHSYPLRSQSPEARVAIRLSKSVDWNIGYQYYSYRETPFFNPFASINLSSTVLPANPQFIPAQNYTAHLAYTSLRFYFGGARDR